MKPQHLWLSLRLPLALIISWLSYGLTDACNATEAGRNPEPSGVLGIQVGNMPPPGFYLSAELVYITADRFNDSHGQKAFPNFKLDAVGVAPRFLWNTGEKWLGADVLLQLVQPFVYLSVQNPPPSPFIPLAPPFGSDQRFAPGDTILSPLLGWHLPDLHITAGVDFILPTGAYNKNRLGNAGMNTFTISPAIAITYMPVPPLELSAKFTYDHYFRNPATGYVSGDALIVEYAGNYVFNTSVGPVAPGIGGYVFKQIADDTLAGTRFLDGFRGQAVSIGPEVRYIHPSGIIFEAKYQREFQVENRAQGSRVFARVAFRF